MGQQKSKDATAGADPLIDELRTIRKDISDQFGNDVDRLCEHLKEVERDHTGPVVKANEVRRNLPRRS